VLAAEDTLPGGTARICRDLAEAEAAEASGLSRGDILIEAAPRQAAGLIQAGWQVVLDADATGSPEVAAAVAAAALGAWLGVAAVRSRHVTAVGRAVDMAESIRGTRPVPGGGRARS
jgi:hypothetical protein